MSRWTTLLTNAESKSKHDFPQQHLMVLLRILIFEVVSAVANMKDGTNHILIFWKTLTFYSTLESLSKTSESYSILELIFNFLLILLVPRISLKLCKVYKVYLNRFSFFLCWPRHSSPVSRRRSTHPQHVDGAAYTTWGEERGPNRKELNIFTTLVHYEIE